MIKQEQVKIYSFTMGDIDAQKLEENGEFVIEEDSISELHLKEIALSQSMFTRAYFRYTGTEFKNHMLVTDICKMFMPLSREKADLLIEKGLIINGECYKAYIATPAMQKKETAIEKCEMFFIKETIKDGFVAYYEHLISLGKIEEKFKDNKVCINKKVTSRISLGMSGTHEIAFIPKMVVVPNSKFTYYGQKYERVEDDVTKISIVPHNEPRAFELHDGQGFMSFRCAKAIKESMQLEDTPYWAIIRLYNGLGVKGACMTIDFEKYAREHNNGNYMVKDVWGETQSIENADLILTESMVKWAKNFNSIDEVYELLSKQTDKDLIEKLYVTKTSKDNKKVAKKVMTSYQLLSNLAITFDDMKELAKPTFDFYKRIAIDYNIDDIKLFLKDIVDKKTDVETDDEGNIVEEVGASDDVVELEKILPSTKSEALLNINENFLRLGSVKASIRRLLDQKINHLRSGKVIIEGNYKLMSHCPFALLNSILGIEDGRGELLEKEFYIHNKENQQFVIARSPIAAFNELMKISTVTNDLYKEYLGHLGDEIIVFNAKDDTAPLMSGADMDGDICLCTPNKIILDSVIETDSHFINPDDGNTGEEQVYNEANKFDSLIRSSGNMIGSIAVVGAVNSNLAQKNDTKESIRKAFIEERKDYAYYSLYLSMLSIDAPKTLIMPSKKQRKLLKPLKDMKKPNFMKYRAMAQNKYDNDLSHLYENTDSTLDKYAYHVYTNLKKKIKDQNYNDNRSVLHKRILNEVKAGERVDKCRGELNQLQTMLSDLTKNACNRKNKKIEPINEKIDKLKKLKKKIYDEHEEKTFYDRGETEVYKENMKVLRKGISEQRELKAKEIQEFKKDKDLVYNACLNFAQDIEERYDTDTICTALKLEDCTEAFIIKYFFKSIVKRIEVTVPFVFREVEDGTEGAIEHFFSYYVKENAKVDVEDVAEIQDKETVTIKRKVGDKVVEIKAGGVLKDSITWEKRQSMIGSKLQIGRSENKEFGTQAIVSYLGEQFGFVWNTDDLNLLDYSECIVNQIKLSKKKNSSSVTIVATV